MPRSRRRRSRDRVIADPQGLTRQVVQVVGRVRAARSACRRRRPSRARSRTMTRRDRGEPGTRASACASDERASTTMAPRPRADSRSSPAAAGSRGPSPRAAADPPGWWPHPREVSREGRLPGEQRPGDASTSIRASSGSWRRSKPMVDHEVDEIPVEHRRSGTVGRVDHDRVLVGQRHLVERAVHRRRERPGVLGAEQVRPPDGPDQQRPAGQDQERLVGPRRVGNGIADVLGRVAGCRASEPDRTDVEGARRPPAPAGEGGQAAPRHR